MRLGSGVSIDHPISISPASLIVVIPLPPPYSGLESSGIVLFRLALKRY